MHRNITIFLAVLLIGSRLLLFPIWAEEIKEGPKMIERETFTSQPCMILAEGEVRGQIHLTLEDEDVYRFYLSEERPLSVFFESQVKAADAYFEITIVGDKSDLESHLIYNEADDYYELETHLKVGWYAIRIRMEKPNYAFVNETYYLSLVTGPDAEFLGHQKKEKVLDYGPITYSRYLQQYGDKKDNPYDRDRITTGRVPSDFPSNLYLAQQYYLDQVHAYQAWEETTGAAHITVAVIDRGMDITHYELEKQLLQAYTITGHITDDIHGTHVGAIVGASHTSGIHGIAPDVSLIYVRPFKKYSLSTADLPEAIRYAVDHGADVINLSIAFSFTKKEAKLQTALDEAIAYAYAHNTVIVAAVGNDGREVAFYPSRYETVLAVSSVNVRDRLSDFSNYGSHVDLCAPGENILSADVNGHYAMISGTSMAAPIVTGVAALILSINDSLTPDEVKEILIATATDLGDRGWDPYYGYGRVDAKAAVDYTLQHYGVLQSKEISNDMTRIDYIKKIMIDYNFALVTNSEAPFLDLDAKDYFNVYLHSAYAYGLITGRTMTTFDPYGLMTEAEKQMIDERIVKINHP